MEQEGKLKASWQPGCKGGDYGPTCQGWEPSTCIAGGAHFGLGQALLVTFAVAKVGDLHQRLGAAIKQGVLQLDVAVYHTHFVAVVQPHYQLLEKPACIILLWLTDRSVAVSSLLSLVRADCMRSFKQQ